MRSISRLTHSVPGRIVVASGVVLALGGGSATAATFITSKQIKDGTITVKDLSKTTVKQLQGGSGKNGAGGANGSQGSVGPAGPVGPAGAPGAQGIQGPAGVDGAAGAPGTPGSPGAAGASAFATMPAGATIGGMVTIDDHGVTANDLIDTAGSFGAKLPNVPVAKIVGFSQYTTNFDQATDAQCPGSVAVPDSAPGVLCVYIKNPINVKPESVSVDASSTKLGFELRAGAAADGDTEIEAVWSYKAS